MHRRAFIVAAGMLTSSLGAWFSLSGAQTRDQETQAAKVCLLKVDGMTCGGCEAAVRSAAKKAKGVADAEVSYAKGTAKVTYDPAKTTPVAIAKTITDKSGFKAKVQK